MSANHHDCVIDRTKKELLTLMLESDDPDAEGHDLIRLVCRALDDHREMVNRDIRETIDRLKLSSPESAANVR